MSNQAIAFEFDVSEPQKKEGAGALDLAYWVYKITARTNLSQYRNMAMVVQRRYSDFDWLRQQMVLTFPGIIVPPIPEKELAGTMQKVVGATNTAPLLQYRQRNLRRFLMRVGAHAMLGASLLLQEFLEMSDTDWGTRMKSGKKRGEGAASSMKKLTQKISGAVTGSGVASAEAEVPLAGLPTQVSEYVTQLEAVLTVLKDKLVIYAHRRKEATIITRELGRVFMHLGEVRDMYDDPTLSKALTEIGSNAINISSVSVNQSDLELTQLAESVQYYLGICSAIRETVGTIVEARSDLQYLNQQLNDAIFAKQKAESAGNAANVAKADGQIPSLTASRDAKKKDLQILEGTFTAELARVHQEKLYDFFQLLQCFADIQVEYADKMKKSWDSLLPLIRTDVPHPDVTPLS